MKNMFKIVAQGDPTHVEMSPDVLDMALKISTYIDNNFDESDFFTLGNVGHEDFSKFRSSIEEAQSGISDESDTVSLSFDTEQYRLFDTVMWYGSNFGDDITELEPLHDDICDVREEMKLIAE